MLQKKIKDSELTDFNNMHYWQIPLKSGLTNR